MRNYLFYFLALILVGCGSDGSDSKMHAPQITSLAMSADSATYMEDGGNFVISVDISFSDTGRDIRTLWVRMPDGTTTQFSQSVSTETGTITEDFVMSTQKIGVFDFDFWLVDESGYYSIYHSAEFKS